MSDSNALKRVQEANIRAGLKGRCTVRGSFAHSFLRSLISLGNATKPAVCRPESLAPRAVAPSRPSRQVATCPRTCGRARVTRASARLSSREFVCSSRCVTLLERAHSTATTHPSNVKQGKKKSTLQILKNSYIN